MGLNKTIHILPLPLSRTGLCVQEYSLSRQERLNSLIHEIIKK